MIPILTFRSDTERTGHVSILQGNDVNFFYKMRNANNNRTKTPLKILMTRRGAPRIITVGRLLRESAHFQRPCKPRKVQIDLLIQFYISNDIIIYTYQRVQTFMSGWRRTRITSKCSQSELDSERLRVVITIFHG